jgi:hypothetical protein
MSPAMANPLAISTLTAVIQEARRTALLIQSTRDNDSTGSLAACSSNRAFPLGTGRMTEYEPLQVS